MKLRPAIWRWCHRLAVGPLLASAFLVAGGCDRAVLDPTLQGADEAALLRAAGLSRPEGKYTLGAMVLEAAQTLDRQASGAGARARLERFGKQQAAAFVAARTGDSRGVAAALEQLRQAELEMVAEVLGEPGVERALQGLGGDLQLADAALDAAADTWPGEVASLRREAEAIARSLRLAQARLTDGSTIAALQVTTQAADHLVGLRRGILDLDRVQALPDLYARAKLEIQAADGLAADREQLLSRHRDLEQVARQEVASGDRQRAHAALTAVRVSELQITLAILGPGTAAEVVNNVGKALAALEPGAETADPRLKRMLEAAADFHYRATAALRRGDGVAALDLDSYAAGLVNAYRRAVTPF